MPTLTSNYSFNKPLVNNATDADLWGGYLNANWDSLDTILDGLGYVPAIGDVEFTTGNTNPSTKYPGTTWTLIAEGRFIVGVGQGTDANSDTRTYPAGNDSFGEYEHTLATGELPSTLNLGFPYANSNNSGNDNDPGGGFMLDTNSGQTAAATPRNFTVTGASNDQHENSPPAFGLYVWERTA